MKEELERKLVERWPTWFDVNGSIKRTLMPFGFEHGDGWFGIVWVYANNWSQRSTVWKRKRDANSKCSRSRKSSVACASIATFLATKSPLSSERQKRNPHELAMSAADREQRRVEAGYGRDVRSIASRLKGRAYCTQVR